MSDKPKPDYSKTFGFDLPARSKKVILPILSPKPGKPVVCLSISDRVVTAICHYWRRVSYPCTNDEATCSFDHATHPPRARGYLAVVDLEHMRLALAELTLRACERLVGKGLFSAGLRGKKIKLYRASEAKNSEVLVHVLTPTGTEAQLALPPEPDVVAVLLQQWGNPYSLSREELHPDH